MNILRIAIPLLIYPLAGYILLWGHYRLRRGSHANVAWIPLALLGVYGLILAYLTVALFGGAFGPGSWMLFLALPFALLGLLLHLRFNRKQRDRANHDASRPKLRWWRPLLLSLLVIGVNLAPIIGYGTITTTCFNLHVRMAEPVIFALEAFKAEKGDYPSTVQELVPAYLESLPSPACFAFFPSSDYQTYTLLDCPPHVLWLDVVQGGFPQRLNLATGKWSSISFLDGICSFLD